MFGPKKTKRRGLHFLALVLFGFFVFLAVYAIYAGKLVTERMSELKWDLPSRVYSAPIILYPGATMVESDLKEYFSQLGYREAKGGSIQVGQWRRKGRGYEWRTRPFQDVIGKHASTRIEVAFTGRQLDLVHSDSGAGEDSTVTLEPRLIGEIYPSKREDRTIVRLKDVPETLRQAILVMEDQHFYSHFGISFRGMARAFFRNIRGGKVTEGGSTLTQQLMKNFFLSPDRTFRRKIRELVMTLVTERLYSKDEIFEAYINEIYLGQRKSTSIHGFGEAAQFYFSKEIGTLTLGEQAILASLIRSPGKFSPYEHPDEAKKQRRLVLQRLLEAKIINENQFSLADREPIEPRGKGSSENIAPFYVDFVKSEISEQFSQASLEKDGYEIHTTLDPFLQEEALRAVNEGLKAIATYPKLKKTQPLEAALIAVVPQTGAVKAMVGGREYASSQFNRAVQARRQIGSSVKPFVAAVALSPLSEKDLPVAIPSTLLEDRPSTFAFSGRDWSPKNYEDTYFGETTLRGAIEFSLNVATVNLAAKVGLTRISQSLEEFGFKSFSAVPAVVLGALEASPIELARAYTVFANGGIRTEPHGIVSVINSNGERLEQRSMEVKTVIDPRVAFLVTHILKGVIERGTARSVGKLGIIGALAGKTGTTQDNRDSWFVGYSPNLLTVVWLGFDQESTTGLTGASGALQVWIRFMRGALARLPSEEFVSPSGIHFVEVDAKKGCIGGAEKLKEAFLDGTEPPRCP